MSDERILPESPAPNTQVNVGAGNMGLSGVWGIAGNVSAMVLVGGAFLYLMFVAIGQNREDRREDRTLFRESLEKLQVEDNRRTGELKGCMDAANTATRELTVEIKSWRRDVSTRPNKGPEPQ